MKEQIKRWIIDWFDNNTEAELNEILDSFGSNYFEMGFIDSFKFMTLVSNIEEYFDIEFSNEEFQDRKFATMNGLMEIIVRKQNS